MSEAVGGCHANADEKIGRLDERPNFNRERNIWAVVCSVIALIVSVCSLFIAWTAMRDNIALQKDITKAEYELKRIEQKAEDAKAEATRGYNYIRKNKSSL